MNTPYNFQDDLSSLRILLSREAQFADGYKTPLLENHIRPLVITFDNWLRLDARIRDSELRRKTRLAMLSYILQREIRSSYDISVYQCTTITNFLWYGIDGREPNYEEGEQGYPQGLGDKAKQFLMDLQTTVKE